MATEAIDTTRNDNGAKSDDQPTRKKEAPNRRVVTRPGDVAGLVMMQVDAVNAKKDELTIAIKGLTDTAKQLVRAYADHAQAIVKLQQRIKLLEERASDKEQ